MEYAAVIIPTLNRINHLQRCVESLKKNSEAKNTDLYISVDYPPNEKYFSGYDEVKNYVIKIDGFHNVFTYFQEKNLGPGLNRQFLEKKISSLHDKYVFTDDDNEFSLNFLAYVNWGLEKYKDDDNIYAICSKTDFKSEGYLSSDYMLLPSYTPYGAGHWLHKNLYCSKYLQQKNIEKIYKSIYLRRKINMFKPFLLYQLSTDALRMNPDMRGKKDNISYIDIWENVYCIINDKKCVLPVINKSINWGRDGSGVHKIYKIDTDEILDTANIWNDNPKRCSIFEENENRILLKKKFSLTLYQKMKNFIVFFGINILGLKIFNFFRDKYIKIKKKENDNHIFYG